MTPNFSRLCFAVVAIGLSCTGGCRWLMDTSAEKTPIKAPPLQVTTRVAPVQAEEITPSNARSKAQLLLEEIEQDAGQQ